MSASTRWPVTRASSSAGTPTSSSTAAAQTAYDIDPDAIRATGYPDAESWLSESFLDPVDPDYVTRLFEDRNNPG